MAYDLNRAVETVNFTVHVSKAATDTGAVKM